MAKQITLDKIQELTCVLRFNQPVEENDAVTFYAVTLIVQGMAGGGGVSERVNNITRLGPKVGQENTPHEIYQVVNSFAPALANKLKALYQDAINEDIS